MRPFGSDVRMYRMESVKTGESEVRVYHKRFLANARPEQDFKYFSNCLALASFLKLIIQLIPMVC